MAKKSVLKRSTAVRFFQARFSILSTTELEMYHRMRKTNGLAYMYALGTPKCVEKLEPKVTAPSRT
jgi:hypothetical protein